MPVQIQPVAKPAVKPNNGLANALPALGTLAGAAIGTALAPGGGTMAGASLGASLGGAAGGLAGGAMMKQGSQATASPTVQTGGDAMSRRMAQIEDGDTYGQLKSAAFAATRLPPDQANEALPPIMAALQKSAAQRRV